MPSPLRGYWLTSHRVRSTAGLVVVVATLLSCGDAPTPEVDVPAFSTDLPQAGQSAGANRSSSTEAESPLASTRPPVRGGAVEDADGLGFEATLEQSPPFGVLLSADPERAVDGVAVTSRLRRLTRTEYERVVHDLLGVEVSDVSSELPEELPTLDGYFALGALEVGERLVGELQRAAEVLASRLVQAPGALQTVVGCGDESSGCRDEFLRRFGRRAYRRDLQPEELSRFQELFDRAADWIGSGSPFRDGVQVVVEAMLQSPHFLYRVERGGPRDESGAQALTDFELATRMSFLLQGTTPDDELLDAAAARELSDPAGRLAHARRMLSDPSVGVRVNDFHDRWLRVESLGGAGKDETLFPDYSPALVEAMRAEQHRFVEETTLQRGGALAELLTAPYAFVNQNLASLYELQGDFTGELVRVDLDPRGPRGGLLTQGSFLAGHSSSSSGTSPILRGVFVLRRLLCQAIPDPPPNAQATEPPPSEVPLVTTRDYFEWKTSMAACQGCHSMINPVGFSFENFDAIGRHRETDNGAPVDATGSLRLGGDVLELAGARDAGAQLAQRPEARACYARNWLRYLWGRADTDQDLHTLAVIVQGLEGGNYGVRDLLLDVVRSAAFSHLLSPEAQP